MHIPDGFIDLPTSALFAGAAAVCVAVSLKGARKELDDKSAPLAGLTAVFIFAVQMLNFPVGAGTSGHLLGGALAAVLVGPWAAIGTETRPPIAPASATDALRFGRSFLTIR